MPIWYYYSSVCTTVICTDKTGTLTTNQMTVVALVMAQQKAAQADDALREYPVDGVSYAPQGRVVGLEEATRRGKGAAQLVQTCVLCNDAEITYSDGQYGRVGEPTEAALKAPRRPGTRHNSALPPASPPPPPSPPPARKVPAEQVGVRGTAGPADAAAAATHYSSVLNAGHERQATLEFSRSRKSMSVLSRQVGARLKCVRLNRRANIRKACDNGAPLYRTGSEQERVRQLWGAFLAVPAEALEAAASHGVGELMRAPEAAGMGEAVGTLELGALLRLGRRDAWRRGRRVELLP